MAVYFDFRIWRLALHFAFSISWGDWQSGSHLLVEPRLDLEFMNSDKYIENKLQISFDCCRC